MSFRRILDALTCRESIKVEGPKGVKVIRKRKWPKRAKISSQVAPTITCSNEKGEEQRVVSRKVPVESKDVQESEKSLAVENPGKRPSTPRSPCKK